MSKAGKRQPAHVVTVAPWGKSWVITVDAGDLGMLMGAAKKSLVVACARAIARERGEQLYTMAEVYEMLKRCSRGQSWTDPSEWGDQ